MSEAQELLNEKLNVLGLDVLKSVESLGEIDHTSLVELACMHGLEVKDLTSEDIVLALINLRADARRSRNYSLADEIRDQLQLQRIELEDAAQETKWSVI